MTRLPGGWRRRSVESLVVVAWLLGPALPLVSARPTHTVHEDGPGALTGAMVGATTRWNLSYRGGGLI